MVNKPKRIGTNAETAVTRFARENGFPLADRRPLKGRDDEGDILLCPGFILEVKAGKSAQTASFNQIRAWVIETLREQNAANAPAGFLVVQRQGYGLSRVGEWGAWSHWGEANSWLTADPIQLSLRDALDMMRRAGWGDPL